VTEPGNGVVIIRLAMAASIQSCET